MRRTLTAFGPASMRRTLLIAASVVMLAASCSGDSPRGGPGVSGSGGSAASADGGDTVIELGSGDVVLTAGLVRFDDCDTLLDYLHEEYSARVGPWGFDRGGWFGPTIEAEAAMAESADGDDSGVSPSASRTAAPVEGVDFSGTNVQEAGVDEADIVKTDGRRIFTLSSGQLVVVDVASRTRTGSA